MKEFLTLVLGEASIASWASFLLFAVIGSILFSSFEVSARDVKSKVTPRLFSWNFFVWDNIKRYVFTLLLIFVQLRFFKELTGSDLVPYTALLMGFSSDGIAGFSKRNLKVLQADRVKLLETENEKS